MADGAGKRPRSHVLETLSRRQFETATPPAWVTRPLAEDYGIDYEVELFDHSGRPTGLTFKVQLKSTDSDSSSLSLKTSDFAYWISLDVPVLLVLYKDGTKELLSKWAHAHDPGPAAEGQKTTTVHFEVPYSRQLEGMERELVTIREVRAGALRIPLTLSVADANTEVVLRIRQVLREALGRLDADRFVRVVNDDDAYFTIRVGHGTVTVSAPTNVASVTMHDAPADLEKLETLGPDLLGLVGVLLVTLDAEQAAGDLMRAVSGELSDRFVDAFALQIATAFAASRRWDQLANLLRGAAEATAADDIFTIAVMAAEVIDIEGARQVIDVARSRASAFKKAGHNDEASRWLFNAASIALEVKQWEWVEELLASAADTSDRYAKSPDFFQMAGKARFNLDLYPEALEYYQQAWDLGWSTDQAQAALAEALLRNGKYAKAREHLRAADQATLSRWAVLMKVVVEDLIDVVEIDEQDRRPITEEESAELDHVRDADTLMRLLRERDALNSVVMDRYLDAIEELTLGSAVWLAVTVDQAGLWARAIVVAIITGADELYAQAVVQEAALHHPEVLGLVEEMLTSMSAPLDDVMPWLIQQASVARAYEPPARHFLQPTDVDEGDKI